MPQKFDLPVAYVISWKPDREVLYSPAEFVREATETLRSANITPCYAAPQRGCSAEPAAYRAVGGQWTLARYADKSGTPAYPGITQKAPA